MLREAAEATLAGQVNNWDVAAKRHATDVVALIDDSEVVRLREQLTGLKYACENLSARIIEKPDNAFVFAYGSRGVVEAFRKRLGEVTI